MLDPVEVLHTLHFAEERTQNRINIRAAIVEEIVRESVSKKS